MSAMMEKAEIINAPPPSPCRPRNTISWIMPPFDAGSTPNCPDRPHSAEPRVKITTPVSSTGLRP